MTESVENDYATLWTTGRNGSAFHKERDCFHCERAATVREASEIEIAYKDPCGRCFDT